MHACKSGSSISERSVFLSPRRLQIEAKNRIQMATLKENSFKMHGFHSDDITSQARCPIR